MTATVHLVAGSTGAGKTTYSMALAAGERALRLSIDEWMTTLFGPDQPAQLSFAWMKPRVDRCEAQMWLVALQAAELGTSVVIDCGLTRMAQRTRWATLATSAGLAVRLHHLDVEREERWRRVQSRNAQRGPTYSLEVTRPMFDFVETMWEPPSEVEMSKLNGRRVSPGLEGRPLEV